MLSRFFKNSFPSFFKTSLQTHHLTKYQSIYRFSSLSDDELDGGELISFYFVSKGQEIPVQGRVGENILEVAKRNQDLLEGACDQSAQCSTCHVILDEDLYNNLPSPNLKEEDLLDMAFGMTKTSRLGCQVNITREFAGIKVELPNVHYNLCNLGDNRI